MGTPARLVANFTTETNVSGPVPSNVAPAQSNVAPPPVHTGALSVTPPKPVYTREGDSTALVQTAMQAAQWTPTQYRTADGRPLWTFVGDREGATIAAGDGSGGIWHAYTGPVVV